MDRQGEFSSTIYSPWCVWSFFFFSQALSSNSNIDFLYFLYGVRIEEREGYIYIPATKACNYQLHMQSSQQVFIALHTMIQYYCAVQIVVTFVGWLLTTVLAA